MAWFCGDFLQLYLKYKKIHSGIVAQNLQLYRKYKILVCKGIYNYIVNKVYENGNISVKFKFADELRKIAEYIEINTTEDTAVAG